MKCSGQPHNSVGRTMQADVVPILVTSLHLNALMCKLTLLKVLDALHATMPGDACCHRMEKGRLAVKQRAAALEAAEAARRFQQETLGEQAEEAGGPNVTRFVEQLSGRVRSHQPFDRHGLPDWHGQQCPAPS